MVSLISQGSCKVLLQNVSTARTTAHCVSVNRTKAYLLFSSLFFNMVFLYLRSSENFSGSVVSVSLAAFSFSSTSDHQRTRFRHFSLRPCVLTLVPFQRLKHRGRSVWTLVSHGVLLYTVRHTRVWGPRLLLFGFPNVTAFCPNLGFV